MLWCVFPLSIAFKVPHISSVVGEIHFMTKGGRKLLNPLVAAQNFENKMQNILGKQLRVSHFCLYDRTNVSSQTSQWRATLALFLYYLELYLLIVIVQFWDIHLSSTSRVTTPWHTTLARWVCMT